MSGWIKLLEDKPPYGQNVLVFMPGFSDSRIKIDERFAVGHRQKSPKQPAQEWRLKGYSGSCYGRSITHWRPLIPPWEGETIKPC